MSGLGNRDQVPPKKPWDFLGITKEEYEERAKQASEGLNKIIEEVTAPYLAAFKKYEPMIARLTLEDFIGIKMAVDREAPRRHALQMATNPFYEMAAKHGEKDREKDGKN